MTNATTGRTYFSGNTIYPTTEVVLAVTVDVPAKQVGRWAQCGHRAVVGEMWVRSTTGWSPMSVWGATRYESHDEMIAAYHAKRAA